jgi:AcrR family transcriptional regulator
VYAAAIEELIARPYAEISIETIAARAGVHRTTLYRRWGSSTEVVLRALEHSADAEVDVADTGALETDLLALTASVAEVLNSPSGAAVLRAFVAGGTAGSELGAVARAFWSERREAVSAIVRRAVERGELSAATDAESLMQVTVAPLYFAVLIRGEAVDERLVRTSVAAGLAAAAAGVFGGVEPAAGGGLPAR